MTIAIAPAVQADLVHARRDRVRILDVPERRYLAVDGCERPGGQTFRNAIATLYPIAYTLHGALKRAGVRAPLGQLEGLYWPNDLLEERPASAAASGSGLWSWRLLIPIPDMATEQDVEEAIRDAASRRTLPAFSRLHVVRWREGPSAQLLHVGRYSAEGPATAKLSKAIAEAGLEACGPHHEIYLNNPSQVGEDRARTVIRQAVRPCVAQSTKDGSTRAQPRSRSSADRCQQATDGGLSDSYRRASRSEIVVGSRSRLWRRPRRTAGRAARVS